MTFFHCIRLNHGKCSIAHIYLAFWAANVDKVSGSLLKVFKKLATKHRFGAIVRDRAGILSSSEPLSSQTFYETYSGYIPAFADPKKGRHHYASKTRC